MEPLYYGEVIAERIREARQSADRERRAMRPNLHETAAVPAWRVALGRRLVNLGDRVAGCAELARGEVKPAKIRLLG
jgi:uncharacterized protein Yka (UPF0111/DUF47 family)